MIQLGDTPTGSQIFDTNTHSLKALCVSYGLEVVYADVVNDDFGAICEKKFEWLVKKSRLASYVWWKFSWRERYDC